MTARAGGLQVIREAVAARPNAHAIMGRDCGVGISLLDAFAAGRADIPAENLDRIVKWMWPYIEYNAQADALQPIPQPEARSIRALPELTVVGLPFTPGANQNIGPQPVDPPPPKPKSRGWIGGWR